MDERSSHGLSKSENQAVTEETGKHLLFLDGWRGVAIGLVLIGHFWADEHLWSGTSKLGVELFFVLSGRLMAEILFVRRFPLPTFFGRRLSRVYPGLAAYVLLASAAFYMTPYRNGPAAALLALTFTINYAMVFSHPVALLDHLWSLCVEEHSYILLAFLAALHRERRLPVAPLMLGAGVLFALNGVYRTAILHDDYLMTYWRTDVSAAGIFLAGGFWLLLGRSNGPAWLALLALAGAVICKSLPLALASSALATMLMAFAVVMLDRSPIWFRNMLSAPWLRQIGLWSYSLYLWQQPFYKMNRDGLAPTPLLVAGAVLCALASFYLVENPARRWLNQRIRVPVAVGA
jgi:peptidoglycan/LPS O-acetylase OafA/YrhL